MSSASILERVKSAVTKATEVSSDEDVSNVLVPVLESMKLCTDELMVELLNNGVAELLLRVLCPPPGGRQATMLTKQGNWTIQLIETLAKFAEILGYGSISPSNAATKPEKIRRFAYSLDQPLGEGDPLVFAITQSPAPLHWMSELADAEIRGGGAASTFEMRSRRMMALLPLLHATFRIEPAEFFIRAHQLGLLQYWLNYFEELVSVLFLLLPKAIRQQCVQEWAVMLRSTSYPAGTIVPEYESGWAAINMRVKSTNKFGLAIETVMSTLEQMMHFLFTLSAYPPCIHELKSHLKSESIPVTTHATLAAATSILQRFADYAFHACRFLIRWVPLTKAKASCLLSMMLWVEGTLVPSHPALSIWQFWWNSMWILDLAKRIRSIPTAEAMTDVPPLMRFELNLAASAVEVALSGVSLPVPLESENDARMLKAIDVDICCDKRRSSMLKEFVNAALVGISVELPKWSGKNLTTATSSITGNGFAVPKFVHHRRISSATDGSKSPQKPKVSLISNSAENLSPSISALSIASRSTFSLDSPFGTPRLGTSSSSTSFASESDEIASAYKSPSLKLSPDSFKRDQSRFFNPFSSPFVSIQVGARSAFFEQRPEIKTLLKKCAFCQKIESQVNEFQVCSGCMTTEQVAYCSADCQLTHWPIHKLNCRK